MPLLRPFSIAALGVLACAMLGGEAVWGQEYLPSMRKDPNRNTVWVDDRGPVPAAEDMEARGTGTIDARGAGMIDARSAAASNRPAAVATDRKDGASRPPQGKVARIPQGAVASDRKDEVVAVVPQSSVRRPETVPTIMPDATTERDGVVAVNHERPIVTDRRAATLRALAEGFRATRPAPAEPTPQTSVAPPSVPVTYATAANEEPAPRALPPRQVPLQVAAPVVESTAAVAEDVMPATVEMLSPIASEASSGASARFSPAEETNSRQEIQQVRSGFNPLRRVADSISQRRNPLRNQE